MNRKRAAFRPFLPILVLSLAALNTGRAFAASIKFCFTIDGTFIDNDYAPPGGTTEDLWVEDDTRRISGARAVVNIGTTTYFDGKLGDGIGTNDPGVGCTPTMTVPLANSTYQFQLYSSDAAIDNLDGNQHTLNVKLDDDDGTVHDINLISIVEHTDGGGAFNVDMSVESSAEVTDLWRLHAASGFALRRTGRWAEPAVVDVFSDQDLDARNHYEDGDIFINAGNPDLPIGIQRKYSIAHEMGHLLADQYAFAVGGDCDLSETQCGAPTHSFQSKEYQTCAFTEGLANFFAAATWNESNAPSERDCTYGYLNFEGVDCEGNLSPTYPEAFMETVCTTTSHTDRGVEIDWLRQFWDVKTDGSIPNFGDMMDWLYIAYTLYGFGYDDPYFELSAAAVVVGGTIQSTWESADDVNGIDW